MVGSELEPVTSELQKLERKLKEPTRTIEVTVRQPVLVSDEMICRIWNRLQEEAGQPVIICKTVDGRITSWRSLKEALAQANSTKKQIEGMYIKNEDSTKGGRVEIFTVGGGRINLHVFSDEISAEKLFGDLEDVVHTGIRRTPGYAWMAMKGEILVQACVMLVCLYILLEIPTAPLEVPTFLAERWGAVAPLAALFITFVVLTGVWINVKIVAAIRHYWPMAALEIGNGKEREQGASRARKVFGGAIVTFVVAAIWRLLEIL